MKKKTAIIVLALIFLGALARFVQVQLGAIGEGNGAESPDRRFLADARSFYTTRFWGGTHNYYEFTIKSAGGRCVYHLVVDELPQGMMSVRQDGWIKWATDSSSVTYDLKGAQLTLKVNP
jgi:hypothetical protein